jgi:hypothetical protein
MGALKLTIITKNNLPPKATFSVLITCHSTSDFFLKKIDLKKKSLKHLENNVF